MERWLTQRLSHRLGTSTSGGDSVCAGVRFLNPSSLVSMLLGRDRDDPWDPDRLVWPLLSVIDAHLDEPWCATLATHLGHGLEGDEALLRRNRRYSVARRLAGLFASYAVQRPSLVTDWREGRDRDGAGAPLDADLGWQAELWRRLLPVVDAPPPDVRHARTLELLEAGADEVDLPDRLSMFGHTRLPVTEVELLRRSPATATSTCGCRSPRRRCGRTLAAWVVRCRATRTPPRRESAIRCWRPWGGTVGTAADAGSAHSESRGGSRYAR